MLALLVVALAGPEIETPAPTAPRDGIAIQLVVDISSSMEMNMAYEEGKQPRIAVVRDVLGRFVEGGDGLKGRANDLIGLVAFARFADTLCPLTLSHDTLASIIRDLKTQDKPYEDGTAIGDALALAAARLHISENPNIEPNPLGDIKSRVIVLLTDGQNNCGRHLPLEAAALAKKWGLRTHVISITSPYDGRLVNTGAALVQVDEPLDPSQQDLKRIASETGGIYRSVSDGKALKKVYDDIDAMEKSRIEAGRLRIAHAFFWPFALAALLLLGANVALETTFLRKLP
jgi:Ca-activated chloride channel family protein